MNTPRKSPVSVLFALGVLLLSAPFPAGAAADGFLHHWVILEPIRRTGPLTDSAVQTAVQTEYFPDQLGVIPHDGDKVTVDATELIWHAVTTPDYNVNLYHFAHALGKPTSNVLFWAVTIVDSPREMPGVRLAIGSNAASVWWVNGKEVVALYNDRQTVIDDGVSKRLTLQKGRNVVRGAIINAGGATDFCARFLDGDGNPVEGIIANRADARLNNLDTIRPRFIARAQSPRP
jgi:hypothetical protein